MGFARRDEDVQRDNAHMLVTELLQGSDRGVVRFTQRVVICLLYQRPERARVRLEVAKERAVMARHV